MKNYLFCSIILLLNIIACKKTNNTPPPSIINIDPDKGAPSMFVTITGMHFDSVATNNTVSFNGITTTIYSISDTSIIVPVPAAATTGKVMVTTNGVATTSANDFVILPGTWVRKANFPATSSPDGRAVGIGFSIGNKGYMGMGTDNGVDFDDLFEYDPATFTWTQKASLGLEMEDAVCMVINNKAYVGIAKSRQLEDFTTQFYEYDPATNVWTRKADFPGAKREGALGIAIGDKGYAGFGTITGGQVYSDFWQYDPSTDVWTRKADFPGIAIYNPIGFSLNDSTAYLGGSITADITTWWQYHASTDGWTQKNNYPGHTTLLPNAMVINGVGYIMGGGFENWLYNPSSDAWTQKAFFGSRVGGSTFVVGDKGYFGMGAGFPGYLKLDIWEYTP